MSNIGTLDTRPVMDIVIASREMNKNYLVDEPRGPVSWTWDKPFSPESVLPVHCAIGELSSPSPPAVFREIYKAWSAEHPEDKHPDNVRGGKGILGEVWHAPRGGKTTRHAALSDELALLLHYRRLQATNDPLQTNFYSGDNDNYSSDEDSDTEIDSAKVEDKPWNIRPSVNEIQKLFSGVKFEKRIRHGSQIGPDFRWVPVSGDFERLVVKDSNANVEPAEKACPAGWPRLLQPVVRLGHLKFRASEHSGDRDGDRGTLVKYWSGEKWRVVEDDAGLPRAKTGKRSANQDLFDASIGAVVSNSNVREWTREERAERENRTMARRKRLGHNGSFPALPPFSMSFAEARAFCGLPPVEKAPFGLPYETVSASHLSMSAEPIRPNKTTGEVSVSQTYRAMHSIEPDGVLIEAQERVRTESILDGMSEQERAVLDFAAYASNFEDVGRLTGGQDNHPRTNERNGKATTLAIAVKFGHLLAA